MRRTQMSVKRLLFTRGLIVNNAITVSHVSLETSGRFAGCRPGRHCVSLRREQGASKYHRNNTGIRKTRKLKSPYCGGKCIIPLSPCSPFMYEDGRSTDEGKEKSERTSSIQIQLNLCTTYKSERNSIFFL